MQDQQGKKGFENMNNEQILQIGLAKLARNDFKDEIRSFINCLCKLGMWKSNIKGPCYWESRKTIGSTRQRKSLMILISGFIRGGQASPSLAGRVNKQIT